MYATKSVAGYLKKIPLQKSEDVALQREVLLDVTSVSGFEEKLDRDNDLVQL